MQFSEHNRTKSDLFLQNFYYSLKAINTPYFILFGELPTDSCMHFVFPEISVFSLPRDQKDTLQWPSWIPSQYLQAGNSFAAVTQAYSTRNLGQSWFQFYFFWFNLLSPLISVKMLCYVQWGPARLSLWNQEVRGCNQEWFLFKEMDSDVFWDIWDFEIDTLVGWQQLPCLLQSSS